jgi:hypothetical protein
MQFPESCSMRIQIPITTLAALLSCLFIGIADATQTSLECESNCSDNLKECRRQVEITTNAEAHPPVIDSSIDRANRNMPEYHMLHNGSGNGLANDEIAKRRMDRTQQCESQNHSCANACSSVLVAPTKSVIFK